MRTKVIVAILVVALAVYMAIVGYQGILLIGSGDPVGVVLGSSVLVLPAVGGYVLWRELQFGDDSAKLAAELQDQGQWPTEILPTRPSGRPTRDAADALFQIRRLEAERSPDDWRAWYRLGLAYDDAGDRKRARQAIRHSIALYDEESARPVPVSKRPRRRVRPEALEQTDQSSGDGSRDDDDQEGRTK